MYRCLTKRSLESSPPRGGGPAKRLAGLPASATADYRLIRGAGEGCSAIVHVKYHLPEVTLVYWRRKSPPIKLIGLNNVGDGYALNAV